MPQSKPTNEISIYHDPAADDEDVMKAALTLNEMFTPQTSPIFLAMFSRQVQQTGMTKQQLSDAVDLLARTNRYPTWKIADIVGFNTVIKTYSRNEVYKQTGQYPSPLFPLVSMAGTEVTVSAEDAAKYHLTIVRDYGEYL